MSLMTSQSASPPVSRRRYMLTLRSKIESFIRSKYESRRWAMEGPPPQDPSILDDGGSQVSPILTHESSILTVGRSLPPSRGLRLLRRRLLLHLAPRRQDKGSTLSWAGPAPRLLQGRLLPPRRHRRLSLTFSDRTTTMGLAKSPRRRLHRPAPLRGHSRHALQQLLLRLLQPLSPSSSSNLPLLNPTSSTSTSEHLHQRPSLRPPRRTSCPCSPRPRLHPHPRLRLPPARSLTRRPRWLPPRRRTPTRHGEAASRAARRLSSSTRRRLRLTRSIRTELEPVPPDGAVCRWIKEDGVRLSLLRPHPALRRIMPSTSAQRPRPAAATCGALRPTHGRRLGTSTPVLVPAASVRLHSRRRGMIRTLLPISGREVLLCPLAMHTICRF